MTLRHPAVAGYFYPKNPQALREQVEAYLKEEKIEEGSRQKALAIVSPHAGYIYSGRVAAAVFSRIKISSKLFILSPNHSGLGTQVAINQSGEWLTPLGEAKIDEELASEFMRRCNLVEEDSLAHRDEHSLEVQIPFVQFLKKDFTFVPLTFHHLPFETCKKIGEDLATCIQESGEEVLIIASTDMNHYESHEVTLKKDQFAIDPILELNPEVLYREVHKHGVTMCGIIPTTIALVAAKKLGAQKAMLVKHATSGDASGDYDSVVGYASFLIS
jgi:AmmeMemoRadiSam system protein B